MSVKDFAYFISADPVLKAFVKKAHLLRLGTPAGSKDGVRSKPASSVKTANRPEGPDRVALVLDAESCLERLYGGYFPDWCCGGQWRHMVSFLGTLVGRLHQHNVQLAVFFNGSNEAPRFHEWMEAQQERRKNAKLALKHINKRHTPPPKAFWVPPCGIYTALRMALKWLNVHVINTVGDYHQELMSFCWENGYHAVVTEDAEFAFFNPPRMFSALSVAMFRQQNDVTTKEFGLDGVARSLDLNPNRFCLLATLLGNHILSPADLADFHKRLVPKDQAKDHKQVVAAAAESAAAAAAVPPSSKYKVAFGRVIRAVTNYIRALPSIDALESVASDVFSPGNEAAGLIKLQKSMAYYAAGSMEGYRKRRKKASGANDHCQTSPALLAGGNQGDSGGDLIELLDLSHPADEHIKARCEKLAPQKSVKKTGVINDRANNNDKQSSLAPAVVDGLKHLNLNGDNSCPAVNGVEPSSAGVAKQQGHDPSTKVSAVLKALASGEDVRPSEDGKYPKEKPSNKAVVISEMESNLAKLRLDRMQIKVPSPSPRVLQAAQEHHRHGNMSPYILQVIVRGEIKLPVLLEDLKSPDLPPIHEVYDTLRNRVYAILLNVHLVKFHQRQKEKAKRNEVKSGSQVSEAGDGVGNAKKGRKDSNKSKLSAAVADDSATDFRIREWLPYNNYDLPEVQVVREMRHAKFVSPVEVLWFGKGMNDQQERIRAFLNCFEFPEALVTSVPQHLLIFVCILRYLMTCRRIPLLKKPELDAFLVTALRPELGNLQYLDELVLDFVHQRAVHLATLFMQGLEMAIFANDACGAPLSAKICAPWLFFDGKLFHALFDKAIRSRNLLDLCSGRMDLVNQVETLRAVIISGLSHLGSAPPNYAAHLQGQQISMLLAGSGQPSAYHGGAPHLVNSSNRYPGEGAAVGSAIIRSANPQSKSMQQCVSKYIQPSGQVNSRSRQQPNARPHLNTVRQSKQRQRQQGHHGSKTAGTVSGAKKKVQGKRSSGKKKAPTAGAKNVSPSTGVQSAELNGQSFESQEGQIASSN